jgi:hypothetical protein
LIAYYAANVIANRCNENNEHAVFHLHLLQLEKKKVNEMIDAVI